ncbi:MAG: hypothetical protein RLZZ436_1570 [Planctomycetota bacterium]
MAGRKKQRGGRPDRNGGVRGHIRRSVAAGGVAGGVAGDVTAADSEALWFQLRQNPAGLWGLGLSVLQLIGHAAWLSLVVALSGTAEAAELDASSPLAWLIVGLLGGSLLLTGVSLFVCLFYGMRKTPRAPAIVGAAMAFFVGVLVSAAVFLQGLRSMAGP